MRLTTEKGDLDLPFNFSFEMERNNPFLSDEGDATVPATLPSTRRNRQCLDHIERIDRVGDSMADIPAALQVGSFVKNGRLIIDTAHERDGYNVSLPSKIQVCIANTRKRPSRKSLASITMAQGIRIIPM